MRHLKLFEEFIENSDNIIDIKMTEIRDLIESISDEGHNLIYEWENKDNHELIINFSYDGLSVRYEFSVYNMSVTKIVNESIDFKESVESIDEGLDIIEKDIYMILGISEAKRGRPKAGRTKSGRKVPGKYLTKNRKLMKKEIEEFQGKDTYKTEWDADYKSGRGGKGKRHQTKKSAATKAYQRMFGKNEGYKDRFSLTDKYNELPDDLIFPKTNGYEKWLEETPTHIKLLSMICGMIDAEIADDFEFDDRFFSALENEYRYTGFKLTKEEVMEGCYKLKEEGYLE